MIKTVAQTTVADIFSLNNDTVYRIPKYQRKYTWGITEWDALFDDVLENEHGYFLGSYICVNNASINGTTLEVIDGQQRFTTLMLLLTALFTKLKQREDDLFDEDRRILGNLRSELANQKTSIASNGRRNIEYKQRLFLQTQHCNDEDFSYILYNAGIITSVQSMPNNFGNRRISKAYRHFCKLIDTEIEKIKKDNQTADEIGILLEIIKKFESAVLVGIEVDTNKDAYMLFESLNHRGVPLSALDLIKNTLISCAEIDGMADDSYERWKYVLNLIGQDDYSLQERFFRQYYNAFRDELNQNYHDEEKRYYFGYLATRTTLLGIYEKMIQANYQAFLQDLSDKAEYYAIIVNNSEENRLYKENLLDLSRISGAPSYILLLYLLSEQAHLKLTDEHMRQIVNLLIRFFVRRNITDIPNTRKLTSLFMDAIALVKNREGQNVVELIQAKLQSVSASDAVFEEKLRGPIYDENPEATRFMLCDIESRNQTRETYTKLWERDENSKKYKWTIEHVFPEGENIPAPWVQMIAQGNVVLAEQYRSEYVHTVGNLTLTGYNPNLSNMPFEQKRDRKSKDKTKEMGYRNGLYLNQDIVTQESWTIDHIKARTEKLVKLLLDMYNWEENMEREIP